MAKYVVAIDQGTTGTTVLVLDRKLSVKGRVTQEFPQHFPKPGWVEHDLEEIWDSTVSTLRRALVRAGISGKDVPHVLYASQAGLGEIDLKKVRISRV